MNTRMVGTFNHFGDKREVLFGLNARFQAEILRGIADCADDVPPLDVVVRALQAADELMFQEQRDAVLHRHRIVNANPELQERELRKLSALSDAVAAALRARGVDADDALLIAGAGLLVQQAAMIRWARPGEGGSLRELLAEAQESLRVAVNHH